MFLCTLECMGRKKTSALFLKFGVSVGCILGNSTFINSLGEKVSVGVCCWYFGNLPGSEPGKIRYFVYNDNVDPDTNIEIEDEDEDDFGLRELFAENT